MAAMDTNTMLLQMLQLMEARDQAAEEKALKAEEQRRMDQKAAEERALRAEEQRHADLKAAEERAENVPGTGAFVPRNVRGSIGRGAASSVFGKFREFPPSIGLPVAEGRTATAVERRPHRPAAGARGTGR